ncbi:hypothetical protein [Flavobacterium sp. C4GT6]|uniref:hypothetical protein n=1 Tax=Flavobacterium sp. C4GT6 TaxID=3103818 RepID=UPI002ED42455
MKKLVYVFGFISLFLISNGVLFKIMHWPGASIQLCTGVVILNFGYLPFYFYKKYKAQV